MKEGKGSTVLRRASQASDKENEITKVTKSTAATKVALKETMGEIMAAVATAIATIRPLRHKTFICGRTRQRAQ